MPNSPPYTRNLLQAAPLRAPSVSSFRSIGAYAPDWSKVFPLLFVVLLTACARTPPEQALRDTIASMQAAAQARDASALVEHVAADFAGPGGMDRDGLRRYAGLLWLRNQRVGVTLGPLDIALREPHATVEFSAFVTGGQGLVPERAQGWQVHTAWRREGDDWMLISAEWK